MPAAGFKPAIPAIERPQNYASDRRATGISSVVQLAPSLAYILAVGDTLVIIIIIIIIIIIMFIDCKWVDTRWQWSFNMLHMHGLWRLII